MTIRSLLFVAPLLLVACATAPVPPGDSTNGGRVGLTQHYEGELFAADYPMGWAVEEDKHVITDRYESTGTAFTAPGEPTTLNEAFFQVALLPACPDLVEPETVTENGTVYQVSHWSEGAAGTFYRGMSATTELKNKKQCAVITAYMSSCNLGDACEEGHTQAVDTERFDALFSMMLQSIIFRP